MTPIFLWPSKVIWHQWSWYPLKGMTSYTYSVVTLPQFYTLFSLVPNWTKVWFPDNSPIFKMSTIFDEPKFRLQLDTSSLELDQIGSTGFVSPSVWPLQRWFYSGTTLNTPFASFAPRTAMVQYERNPLPFGGDTRGPWSSVQKFPNSTVVSRHIS